jgi:hypothetical protein
VVGGEWWLVGVVVGGDNTWACIDPSSTVFLEVRSLTSTIMVHLIRSMPARVRVSRLMARLHTNTNVALGIAGFLTSGRARGRMASSAGVIWEASSPSPRSSIHTCVCVCVCVCTCLYI